MENLENCYCVKYKSQVIICHFDEISYFSVNAYHPSNLILYTPHLKNGETLVSDVGESGRKQFENYYNYMNKKS
jgi:hypothetical protein